MNVSVRPQADVQREDSQDVLPFGTSRVIRGEEVDQDEGTILATCPSLDLADVRSFSYAALLYSELRSPYAHEYRPGSKASPWSMTSHPHTVVNYANRIDSVTREAERLIHFSVAWMAELALDAERLTRTLAPDPSFKDWWFHGQKKPGKLARVVSTSEPGGMEHAQE